MRRVIDPARTARLQLVTIAAGNKSAPVFARFGAAAVVQIETAGGLACTESI